MWHFVPCGGVFMERFIGPNVFVEMNGLSSWENVFLIQKEKRLVIDDATGNWKKSQLQCHTNSNNSNIMFHSLWNEFRMWYKVHYISVLTCVCARAEILDWCIVTHHSHLSISIQASNIKKWLLAKVMEMKFQRCLVCYIGGDNYNG